MEIDGNIIEMAAVVSSNIEAIGYYPQESKLIVQFKSNGNGNGNVYAYDNVDTALHTAMMNAESHGKFLAKHIKPNHTTTRIR